MKSSRSTLFLAAALAALVGLVAAGCGGNDDIPADAVAVVDGTAITKVSLDDLIGRAKKSYASQKRAFPKAGTQDYQSLQTQAVAYLVEREEYAQEGKALGVEVTDKQIDKRVTEITKQYFGGDKAKLQKQLKTQGYTDAAFRADVVAQVLSEGVTKKVTADVKVTDADIKKYYAENQAQYTVAKSRDVRHILVKTKTQADDVYTQLKGGADFAVLAKKSSLDPGSKDNGGKLTISKGQTVAPFDKVAFSLAADELSKPVKTEFGWHVIQAVGPVKPGSTTLLEDVEAQIKTTLEDKKKQDAAAKWATDTKAKYKDKVTYATGYEPPATTTDTSTETSG